jgi:hypothetical protein
VLFRKSNKAKNAKEAPAAAASDKGKGKTKPVKPAAAASGAVIPLAVTPKAKPLYRKAQPDLYTLMLVVALLAVIVGIIFLCLEMNVYEWKLRAGVMGMLRPWYSVLQNFIL